jgi:taurine dioxygenase
MSRDVLQRAALALRISPVEGPLGAELECGDLRTIDAATARAIREAWLQYQVVCFRKQTLSDEDLVAFGRWFGEFQISNPLGSPAAMEGHVKQGGRLDAFPEITVVSNVVENGVAIGGLGDGEVVWHTDMSSFEAPPNYTLLHALEVPASGGATGFANMYLAYETLPAALKSRADTLLVKQDATIDAAGYVRKAYRDLQDADVTVTPGRVHPLVRTHPETGRCCLYLGRRQRAYILGLAVAESEDLLDELWAHATQPEFTWLHEWRVGDLLMWDNRCVMHRREPFDADARRVLHRVVIKGTPPYGPAAPGSAYPN